MLRIVIIALLFAAFAGCSRQAETPDITIWQAATSGDVAAIKTHLAAGVDVGSVDHVSGATPLHVAAVCGQEAVARLLIREGADIESLTDRGETPLHWAALGGRSIIVELLIEAGANVNASDQRGETALDALRFQPEVAADDKRAIAELLRAKGGMTGKQLEAKREFTTAPPQHYGVADSPK